MTKTQPEFDQRTDRLGDKVQPKAQEVKVKPDAEGFFWRHHKPGFEINQLGHLRTTAK